MKKCRARLAASLRLSLLEEAGFDCACAVTRHLDSLTSVPVDCLEIHHIEPYSKVQCHQFDNLIPLCPNCHEKADRGKLSPWVLQQLKATLSLECLPLSQRKRKIGALLRRYLEHRKTVVGEGFYTGAAFFRLIQTERLGRRASDSLIHEVAPSHHPILVRASLLLELGQAEKARQVLIRVDPRARSRKEYRRLRALAADRIGFHSEALWWYTRLARTSQPSIFLSCNLGDCLIYLGQAAQSEPERQRRFQRALGVFEAAPERHPAILFNKGRLLALMGHRGQAVTAFKEAIELGPRFPLPHVHLADLLANSVNPRASIAHFREALALRPRDTSFLLRASDAALKAGDLNNAWSFLCAFEKNNPYMDERDHRRFLRRKTKVRRISEELCRRTS